MENKIKNKSKSKKISQDTVLSEIYKIKGGEEILKNLGVPCVTCAFAAFEMDQLKIKDICDMYGLDTKKIIKEINKLVVA